MAEATTTGPYFAVVVLAYNGLAELRTFLPSVVAHSHLPDGRSVEVWVVDNASTDGTLEAIQAEFPTVHTHRVAVNRGFAGGYIASLPHIPAENYVLINADVEVTPGWLAPLAARLDSDARIAAIQPKILSERQRTHFEYSGAAGGYIDRWGYPFCRGRLFFTVEEDQGQYNDARPVFWASGACMAIRAHLYHQVGGFDPLFYAHMEEIDLCWRLKNQGYQVWVEPHSVVYHVGGHVIKYGSPAKLYYNYRNGLLMLVKNLRGGGWWLTLVVRMLLDGVAGLRALLTGKFREFGAILRAHGGFYARLGKALQARKALHAADSPAPDRAGRYPKSIVWQYFAKGKRRASHLPARA